MENKVVKDPQIFISKESRKLYDNLRDQFEEFKRMDNKDYFMLVAMFGYLNKKRRELKHSEKTESGFVRERNLTPEESGALKAIAISEENNIRIANNIPRVCSIAEEYANGGFSYLKEFIFDNPASFIKNFASRLKELSK